VSWFCQAYLTTHLTTRAEIRLTRRWIGDRGPSTRNNSNTLRRAPESRRSLGNVQEFYRPSKLSPHFSVIAHIFHSMDLFFACSFLISIIMPVAVIRSVLQLASEKVGLLNSFRSLISCRSPPDRCFEPRSLAGRIQYRFVKRRPPDCDRYRRFSPIW
jgi:hypothetical protein